MSIRWFVISVSAFVVPTLFSVLGLFASEQHSNPGVFNLQAKKYLTNLININTAQPEGNELEAARYIYRQLIKENIDWEIIITDTNRANLVAFLPALAKTNNKPLILVSHLDTVGADKNKWTVPPFKATEKGGYIYGRGASDCKDLTAINLAVLLELKKSGAKLNRDIFLVATADEESGSKKGMGYLVKNYPHLIPEGFALTEGGGIITNGKDNPGIVFIGASEKMNLNVKLTAAGIVSHSSLPTQNNAIYKLANALSKIEKYKPPFKLNRVTRRFFEDIYRFQNQDAKTTIDMLLSDDSELALQAAEAISQNPFFNSQLRDTISPTVISAGREFNSLPDYAEVLLNCRLLYDTKPDEFIDNLKSVIDDEDVQIIVTEEPRLPFPEPMPMDDELFNAITTVSKKFMPESIITGATTSGTTDAEFLRRVGIITYGVGSTQGYDSHSSAHGVDERISLTDFYNQLKFINLIVRELAVEKE